MLLLSSTALQFLWGARALNFRNETREYTIKGSEVLPKWRGCQHNQFIYTAPLGAASDPATGLLFDEERQPYMWPPPAPLFRLAATLILAGRCLDYGPFPNWKSEKRTLLWSDKPQSCRALLQGPFCDAGGRAGATS